MVAIAATAEHCNDFSLRYLSGGSPVLGTVLLATDGIAQVEGSDFAVDPTTGIVTFVAGHIPGAGAVVTAGFEFDVPVRFDTDYLAINLASFKAGDIPEIAIVEVRE